MVALLVVFTVLVFVLVDVALQRAEARRALFSAQAHAVPEPVEVGTLSVPQGLFVDPGHTWFRLETNGHGAVGVDEFAASVLGQIDGIEGPPVGREVRRGDPLFAVQQNGRRATFRAPMDGVVTAVNGRVVDEAATLTSDPYQRGWVCRLKPTRLADGLRSLLVGSDSDAWVHDELERLREFLGRRHALSSLGATAQDGGNLIRGVLQHVDDATWQEVTEQHFLTSPRSGTED